MTLTDPTRACPVSVLDVIFSDPSLENMHDQFVVEVAQLKQSCKNRLYTLLLVRYDENVLDQGCPTFLFGGPHVQFLKWSRAGLSKSIKHKITTVVTLPAYLFMQNKL